jgi:nucleotidyltransferase/DNA polymerase involved in DNA repair
MSPKTTSGNLRPWCWLAALSKTFTTATHLTASAGVSVNKFLAKIASGLNKPDGLTLIRPEDVSAFVETLPIEKFHGIGQVTARKMRELGIHTGADLKQWSEEDLVHRFGKVGHFYYRVVAWPGSILDREPQPHPQVHRS